MHISKISPNLWDCIFRFCENTKCNAQCHDDQTDTKNRVYLTNDLINEMNVAIK